MSLSESDEPRKALVTAYFETEGEAKVKIDNYASLISELEARGDFRKAQAGRLANRAKQDEGIANFLRSRLLSYFDCHKITTMETARYRLTAGNVGGKLSVVVSVEADKLPEKYRHEETVVTADLDLIRTNLEEGQVIDGCSLGERKRTIKIS